MHSRGTHLLITLRVVVMVMMVAMVMAMVMVIAVSFVSLQSRPKNSRKVVMRAMILGQWKGDDNKVSSARVLP